MHDIIPIFIGGCERSGTTLLGSIMGSLENSVVTPESQFKIRLMQEKNPDKWEKLVSEDFRFKLWGIDPPAYVNQNLRKYIEDLVNRYSLTFNKKEATVWVDHTPNNFQHYLVLKEYFPESKFIHIVRDGRAVYSSMLKTDWGAKNPVDAAHLWTRKLAFPLAAEIQDPSAVLRVRYEDLINDVESVRNSVNSYLRPLELSMQSINLNNSFLPSYTKKQHNLVGKRIDRRKVDSWKKELSNREIELFESLTYNLLELFGYKTIFGLTAKNVGRFEKRRMKFLSIFRYRLSSIRFRIRKLIHLPRS